MSTTHADELTHDVVVIGAGVAGALLAKRLTEFGFRVLVIEAGPATPWSFDSYTRHVETFLAATAKGAESAWPPAVGAPQPDSRDESNRVSDDPSHVDQLGNMRPVISYSIPDYTLRGVAYGRQFARQVFQRLGAADHTRYDPADPGYLSYDGKGYIIRGGNHLAGTHIMGTSRTDSGSTPTSGRGTTPTSTWWAAAACPGSGRRT